MIRVRIKIGEGQIQDTYEAYGLIYKEADNRMEAPVKKHDASSYVEQAGENVDSRTVQDAFDYKVQFIVEAPNRNLENANSVIATFNRALYEPSQDSDIRVYKEVTFYNDYKRVKIVGIPEPITEAESLFRRKNGEVMDCAVVSFTIRVCDPAKCDFDLSV